MARGRTVDAQDHSAAAARACLDTIPASAFTRVPVYLEAEAGDSASRVVLPGADSLTTRVAAMVRSSLSEFDHHLARGRRRSCSGAKSVVGFASPCIGTVA